MVEAEAAAPAAAAPEEAAAPAPAPAEEEAEDKSEVVRHLTGLSKDLQEAAQVGFGGGALG
jgi:hypothetical protein